VGENRIGRDSATCQILLSQPSISRTHAVIEADAGGAVIFDPGSSNGSKIYGVRMKPNIRYNLREGAKLILGEVQLMWREVHSESGAEGAEDEDSLSNCSDLSESLFDGAEDGENRPPNFVPETPAGAAAEARVKRLAGIEKSDLTFLPESQSSPLPGSSIRSVCGSFKVPDSPSSGLDTSSFLAPSQPALLPKARPLLGTAGTGTAASSNQPDDSEAAEDNVSVVVESDEEEEEGPELLEKHSLRSDGDVSKEETALRDSTVMVTPEKPATRHDS
jgi:hypothetical protein